MVGVGVCAQSGKAEKMMEREIISLFSKTGISKWDEEKNNSNDRLGRFSRSSRHNKYPRC